VALKRIKIDPSEGVPITLIREVLIQRELRHANIARLIEVVTPEKLDSLYLVIEYVESDLKHLRQRPDFRAFSRGHIKSLFKQLLEALQYCHARNVIHRDVKIENMLLNSEGDLKLCDFGIARALLRPRPVVSEDMKGRLTTRVVTLWYRAPELLLGATDYNAAIDMWSAACVFAELLGGGALFPGMNEIDQLAIIARVCGSPTEFTWPTVNKLEWFGTLRAALMDGANRCWPRRIASAFIGVPPDAITLLDRLLSMNPATRLTAQEALDANYFFSDPPAHKPRFVDVLRCVPQGQKRPGDPTPLLLLGGGGKQPRHAPGATVAATTTL
jgi:cyclin-dependent kinase 12/13